jgi:hypothetical protein
MGTPKDDCEELLGATIPFAEQCLARYGEFYPFGATMLPSGEIALASAQPDDEKPESAEVIALLEGGMRLAAAQGQCKATALVYDVRIAPPGKTQTQDAIAVRLDHRDGYSVIVFFPYALSANGVPELDAPFASSGANAIFAQRQ